MRETFPVYLMFLDFMSILMFEEDCKVTDLSDAAHGPSSSQRASQQCNDASFLTSCFRKLEEYNKRLRIHRYKLEGSCYQIFSPLSPTVLCFKESGLISKVN
jgi:hypothetical protein